MTVHFSIFDDKTSSVAKVNKNGGLIVAPSHYSTAFYVPINSANTPFEIIPAIVDMNFVITGLLLASSKTFGSSTNAETLVLYESMPADLGNNQRTLFQVDMLKNDRLTATAMNLITTKSTSLVGTATDTDVNVTISGFYISI